MRTVGTAALILLITSFGIAREFKDSKGRSMEADLVAHAGDQVMINRGGKEFVVPITIFSLDDQQYIKKWIEENPDAVRYRFGFYADVEKDSQFSKDAPGGAFEDKLKTMPHTYEMIVYNKEATPAGDIEVRYEIYVNDYVDTKGNAFTRLAVGGEKVDKLQTVAGSFKPDPIPAGGRVDFYRTFNLEFYIDRDGGKTDQAATDQVLGVRIRVYKGDKVLGEFTEAEKSFDVDSISWQDARPTEGTVVGRR